MNYLAHLHLVNLAGSSLCDNLMTNYVRGNPWDVWSQPIAEGIQLHRRIDVTTDTLPEVCPARALFRGKNRRVAPIALDVIWDHFLSLHWDTIQLEISLPTFLPDCYSVIQPELSSTPTRFQTLNHHLWAERWMVRYADAAWLEKVFIGIASRRRRLAAPGDSHRDFLDNYQNLIEIFWQFYPKIRNRAARKQL